MYIRNALRIILKDNAEVIKHNIPILIVGDTGVGKEILAKLIHSNSREKGLFIPINASTIPENLFESELFGYKRGAFTDARQDKIGLIEMANNGTLFIDEINCIPYNFQIKFLRVLESKSFYRLGETIERTSNFRLICATNSDLEEYLSNNTFRKDLYFRIKGKTFRIPSLFEECNEILPALMYFLNKSGKNINFTIEAQSFLQSYRWPGNMRELKRFSEICINKNIIEIKDMPIDFFYYNNTKKVDLIQENIKNKVDDFRKKLIIKYINDGNNLTGLCSELEVSKQQVRRILKKLNINVAFKRGRPPKKGNKKVHFI